MNIAEVLDRLTSLEASLRDVQREIAELKARPQPTYAMGGAGNYWPWGSMTGLSLMTGAIGTNVSHETPKGMNGAAGPIGSAENPLIVKDR